MGDRRPAAAAEWGHARPVGERLFLLFLVLTFVLKGIAFSLLTPPWQGPDEPANLSAIARAAKVERIGSQSFRTTLTESLERADFWRTRAWPTDFDHKDETVVYVDSTFSVYYPAAIPAFLAGSSRGVLGSLYAVRLLSVLFGAMTIVFTFLLAREFRIGSPWLPVLAASLVAFVPQFGFITSMVNKDSLAAALGTATLWAMAYTVRRGASFSRVALTGALFAAGILAKPSVAALAAPLIAVAAVGVFSSVVSRRGALLSALIIALTVLLSISLAAVLIDRFPSQDLAGLTSTTFRPSVWLYVVPQAWGHFGWVNAPLSPALYVILLAATALSAAGLLLFLAGRGRRLLSSDRGGAVTLLGLVVSVLAMSLVVMYAEVSLVATQGRFWFPALGAFAVLFVLGLMTLLRVLTTRAGALLWFALGTALNLWVLIALFPARFGAL